ncbi:hypothetical protein GGI17_003234 [Coemansia sp. S146]|nr:hypothetical protein GGI17_003234 [Coemansia sp. S146]
MRRYYAAIGILPSATLDERIRGLFYSGAIYDCDPERMGTLGERRMRQMSSDIRSNADWLETIHDADTRASWAVEAKAMGLTDVEFAYVLDELEYYTSLYLPGSNVRFSAADGVWFSDTLIDVEATSELRDYAAILESLCLQTGTSPQAALKLVEVGEFPGSLDEWRKALTVTETGESVYYIPTWNEFYGCYSSDKFSWLPSEFRVDDNGDVTIESYIKNLHPIKHAALYPIIASIFSKFLPLLEQVVADLVCPRQPRVKPDRSKYYESDEPLPESDNDDYFEEIILWRRRATFVHPQPEPFVAPARPVNPYKLCGRRLQAVVKISSIELTSERPIYSGEDWSVVGLANERIIATGMFFYGVVNIAPANVRFREALSSLDIESKNNWGEEDLASQELGSVVIKDGRCVVFPNIYQYEVPELKLADKTQSGHCKMLTFYFVDPSTRIPSTEIVPPQQQDWYFEDILASEPFRSLPQLVVEGILAKVDFPISLKEAKKLRLQVHQDIDSEDLASDLFEPVALFRA